MALELLMNLIRRLALAVQILLAESLDITHFPQGPRPIGQLDWRISKTWHPAPIYDSALRQPYAERGSQHGVFVARRFAPFPPWSYHVTTASCPVQQRPVNAN